MISLDGAHSRPQREMCPRVHLETQPRIVRISLKIEKKFPCAGDESLGMKSEITRRDFLGSVLLGSGVALFEGLSPAELLASEDEFTGYGGVGEYSSSNGDTLEVLESGHAIRDAL